MSIEADGLDLSAELDRDVSRLRELAAGEVDQERRVGGEELVALEAGVRALLEGERGPLGKLRSLPTWQRLAVVLFLSAAVTGGALVLTPRPDLASYPVARMALTLVLLFGLTASALGRLLRPLHLPPPARWVGGLLLAAGMLMPLLLSVLPLAHQGHPAGEGSAFVLGCLRCLGFGGLLGVPILLVALAVRRADLDGPAIAALAGVAAGLTGNLALQMHCPITDASHLLIGHATLLGILTGGAWLWRRLRRGTS